MTAATTKNAEFAFVLKQQQHNINLLKEKGTTTNEPTQPKKEEQSKVE